MKDAFITHFRHLWRTMEKIVPDFSAESWIHSGHCLTTPARLAFHIVQSTGYYLQDETPPVGKAGTPFRTACSRTPDEGLPSRDDILLMIRTMERKTDEWIAGMEFDTPNREFPWAGPTRGCVALFLIRHSQFHLGEMSALLNEQEGGKAPDHYVEALTEINRAGDHATA